jgi:hypothetical protein
LQLGFWTVLLGVAYLVLSIVFLFLTDVDLMLLIVGWMMVAPIIAAFARPPAPNVPLGNLGGHLGAGLGFAVAMAFAFYASAFVLAPGS